MRTLLRTPLPVVDLNTFRGESGGVQADHSVTKDLLEEERMRYERCRANLETSQQHLADLNEQFNELRAEVEVRLSEDSPPSYSLHYARTTILHAAC